MTTEEFKVPIHMVSSLDGIIANVSFFSKTQLVQHYIDTLGGLHFGGRVMIIDTNAALKLLNKCFPK